MRRKGICRRLGAALLALLLCLAAVPALAAEGPTFSDVDPNHWSYPYVEWAAERGFVKGVGEGRFNPNGTVTRAEACKVLKQIVEYYEIHNDEREGLPTTTDVPQWHWCYDYLDWAYKEGLMDSIDPSGEGKIIEQLIG